MSIYIPSEDTFLLGKNLKNYLTNQKDKGIFILDMGTGSSFQAKICKDLGFNNITTSDININAVNLSKKKGFNSIHSNLFSNLKNKKFDLIVFNPPYLPDDKREPEESKLQTTGGKKGYELIIKFLSQSTNYLKKDGKILLLFSSLSKPNIIKKEIKNLNFKDKLLEKQKLFFEELYVYLIKKTFKID